MRKTIALLCLAALLFSGMGLSATPQQPVSIGYAVRALLPENQANSQVTFFDLWVEPEQTQTLQVVIKNRESKDIEVAIEANTAFTNENGVIEFTYSDVRDVSMKVDFADILVPTQPVITVPARGEAIAEFTLTLPEEPFEGIVYGGLSFLKLGQEKDSPEGGLMIHNIYRYVIGVRLRESEREVLPAFELTGMEAEPTSRPSLILHLRNPQPALAKDIALRLTLRPLGDSMAEAITFEQPGLAMAPNSAMAYRLYLPEGQALEAGAYEATLELALEGRLWQESTTLIIDDPPSNGL